MRQTCYNLEGAPLEQRIEWTQVQSPVLVLTGCPAECSRGADL